ncbi:ubiquitin carboxyl-terminal hydrolase BAP1-like isoform X2 [Gigantopelta aegis]|uniref:ubiquitin carboxyl-terminal hydrolase BAP1-like isoform X2 n=1 Tax=Gigantopelta aegis TaxID=1735272 RepID=UPI001B88A9E7|nr:ubiquitin carboxyl-terminal hydrolase BAP1-like isoform X2 [Gigantopelta aegis]
MNKGWLELESDPGLFTLLVEDFGVNSIQVEEIYDLQKSIEGTVYGFIFLFRWIEERRSRRKTSTEDESFVMDENIVNSIFFAKQIIPNSCATHALLSVLLNSEKVRLGETLQKFKTFTQNMNPEDKGFAIGNMAELASAHNSHARPEPKHLPEKQPTLSTVRTMEAFHFVSYVPICGRLFELDGLKPYPIDHGPCESSQMWTEKFRSVISDRLGMATGGEPYHDIRFNLMAVVPCKRQLYEHKLQTLKTNRQIVLEALQQMVKVTTPGLTSDNRGQAHLITDSVHIKNNLSKAAEKISKSQSRESSEPQTNVKNCVHDSTADTESEKKPNPTSIDRVDNSLSECKNDVLKDPDGIKSECGFENPSVRDKGVKIQISVSEEKDGSVTIPRTVSLTDVTKPLTIETKFGGSASSGPSSESTDTASEVGSVFSSPGGSFHTPSSCQSSPQLSADGAATGDVKTEPSDNSTTAAVNCNSSKEITEGRPKSKHRSGSQGFSPKDLLDLLKNVENEIETCEANLKEEIEKRKKFKIDDCRRTHNYDQFITTFLTMLAEQGQLARLVEQNVNVKKRQGAPIGRQQSKAISRDNRSKARAKRRR